LAVAAGEELGGGGGSRVCRSLLREEAWPLRRSRGLAVAVLRGLEVAACAECGGDGGRGLVVASSAEIGGGDGGEAWPLRRVGLGSGGG